MNRMAWTAVAMVGAVYGVRIAAAEPALTIYNQRFALVRDTITLDLRKGVSDVTYDDITAHVEPASVVLRDPAGKVRLRILEQNYRGDPVSQELLLSLYEGQTLDFLVPATPQTPERIVQGKLIRSSYVPHRAAMQQYGYGYERAQYAMAYSGGGQPLLEMDGKLRFSLPGTPLFPALKDEAVLRPRLQWQLESDQTAKVKAEISYLSGGLTWMADYNMVAGEKDDRVDLVGWVTMDNQSGCSFRDARISLMAGDVSKLRGQPEAMDRPAMYAARLRADASGTPVSEKTFDEYHLYTVQRPTTLLDRQTKQVEFVRASGIRAERLYVYEGAQLDWNRYAGYRGRFINDSDDLATSNPKVWVMREFANTETNGLGIALPMGRVRFYRRDSDASQQFVGENTLDHTPRNERLRVYTGNAFDLVGSRKRTAFSTDHSSRTLTESFEISLRNRKTEPAEIRVVERLYRGMNWTLTAKSNTYLKRDAQTIEFRIGLQPDQEEAVTYTVRYTW
jgi:hypothetical protein